jgi:hypothetical protein
MLMKEKQFWNWGKCFQKEFDLRLKKFNIKLMNDLHCLKSLLFSWFFNSWLNLPQLETLADEETLQSLTSNNLVIKEDRNDFTWS